MKVKADEFNSYKLPYMRLIMLQKISLPSKKGFCFVLSAMMLFMKYFGGFHFRLLPKMGTNECMGECDCCLVTFFVVVFFLKLFMYEMLT